MSGASPSGLEQMRQFIDLERVGIAATLQFDLIAAEYGFVLFEAYPGAHAYNPMGTVHGGYTGALLDSACGCAVHTKLSPLQGYSTLELKVAYHRPMTAETGLIRAEGRVVTFGRRTAFAEAKLVDADGRLHASATSTLLVFER